MNCESPVLFINPVFKRWASGVHTYVISGVPHRVDYKFDYEHFRDYFCSMRHRNLIVDDEGGSRFEYDAERDKWLSENVFACIEDKRIVPVFLYAPCGKCPACSVHAVSELRSRLMLESLSHPGRNAVFVTLTYSDDNLPADGVDRDAVSKFLKRLRGNLFYSGYDTYFRPFYVSEYGSPLKTQRPHYHILLFGANVGCSSDNDGSIENFDKQLRKSWKYGFVHWEVARNPISCASYISKYLVKSVRNSSNVPEGKNPNFWSGPRSSEGGLGAIMLEQILKDYKFNYLTDTHVHFRCPSSRSGYVKVRIPKFILDKIEVPTSRIVTKAIFDLYGEALTHYAVISKLHDLVCDTEPVLGLGDASIIEQFAPSDYYDDARVVPSSVLTDDDIDLLESVNTFGSIPGGTTNLNFRRR